MSEPIYCGLAFGSVSIGMQGELKPCCGIVPNNFPQSVVLSDDHISIKINHERLKEVRRNLINGKWHPACYGCRAAEKIGIDSMRIIWSRTINSAPMVENMNPTDVKFLDLSVGNKCNSKCMTCSPWSSDFWAEEYEYIYDSPPGIKSTAITNNMSEELLSTLTNIEFINFIGGEPMILDEHYNFLNVCVRKGLSKKINLGYVTNATGLNDELINIWKQFKSVGASISIDGYGIINDYIRYPIRFSKVDQNLRRYMQKIAQEEFGMTLSCTISIFNINEFADVISYYISLINEYDIAKFNKTAIFLNRVTSPDYFNSSVLSVEYRKKGKEKVIALKEKIKDLDLHSSFIDTCNLIIAWAEEPQMKDPKLAEQAIHFITKSDAFRKRNIDDYIPGLLDELRSYKNEQ